LKNRLSILHQLKVEMKKS